MMMSGVNLRAFRLEDPETPESLDRVQEALPELLSAEELQELECFVVEDQR
jgi:hypothetical protein